MIHAASHPFHLLLCHALQQDVEEPPLRRLSVRDDLRRSITDPQVRWLLCYLVNVYMAFAMSRTPKLCYPVLS
mgnify:CR=1 FL=1